MQRIWRSLVAAMHILYLCYWSLHEGLTRTSALPSVRALSDQPEVDRVWFCTLERKGKCIMSVQDSTVGMNLGEKVCLWPLHVCANGFLGKVWVHISALLRMRDFCRSKRVNMVWARGSMAGAMAYRLHRLLGLPFVVESFEPYAEYMRAVCTWRPYDPRYWILRCWERSQKQYARYLLPATEGYLASLKAEGLSAERMHVLPCVVDNEAFAFNVEDRARIRNELSIQKDDTLGVYVGKFGKMYLSLWAAALLFAGLRSEGLHSLKLLIISQQPLSPIANALQSVGFRSGEYHLRQLPHRLVPTYLSAADFAFSLQKPLPPMRYISAIKNGEYWANGLPTLLPEGVGDDADIVKNAGAGVCFSQNNKNYLHILSKLKPLIALRKRGEYNKIKDLANKYRNKKQMYDVFKKIFSTL